MLRYCLMIVAAGWGYMSLQPVYAETVLGGLGGRPISTEIEADRQDFRYTLRPGETQQDSVEIINNTPQTVTVDIYPADSSVSSDGSFAVEQKVETREQVGAWITLEQSQVTVPALSSVTVPFTITLPTDTNLSAGDYTGGIMIADAASTTVTKAGLTVSTRLGVRVYVTIPGQLLEAVSIENFTVTPLAADPSVLDVMIAVHNDGNINQTVSVRTNTDMQAPWPRWLARQRVPSSTEATLELLSGQTTVRHFTVRRPWLGRLGIQAYVVHHTSQGDETLVTPLRTYLRLPPLYTRVVLGIYVVALITLEIRRYRRKRLHLPL
jgi:hypothetical protein